MTTVLIDSIRHDANTQVRARIDETVVDAYAEAMKHLAEGGEGKAFPPVVLFDDGQHKYLADGFHRTLAAQRIGAVEIAADVRKGTQQDALWFALGANALHGKQLTRDDKRHAIILALKTWPDRSLNMIADQIGCARSYVQRVGDEVAPRGHVEKVTGKDGKSYPASRQTAAPAQSGPLPDMRDKSGKKLPESTIRNVERAREMAADGYTSRQIAAEIGVKNAANLAQRLKVYGIEVKADKFVKTNHHDPNRIVASIVSEVEESAAAIDLVDLSGVDPSHVSEWAGRLAKSVRVLSAFVRQMKSMNGETESV